MSLPKQRLAQLIAEQSQISEGSAADQVETAVHKILKKLRQGHPAVLPGLGQFRPGPTTRFEFARPAKKGSSRGKK